jgi:hypothetical protein
MASRGTQVGSEGVKAPSPLGFHNYCDMSSPYQSGRARTTGPFLVATTPATTLAGIFSPLWGGSGHRERVPARAGGSVD